MASKKEFKQRRKGLAEYLTSIREKIVLTNSSYCIISHGLRHADVERAFDEDDDIFLFAKYYGMNSAVVKFIYWNYKGYRVRKRTIELIKNY